MWRWLFCLLMLSAAIDSSLSDRDKEVEFSSLSIPGANETDPTSRHSTTCDCDCSAKIEHLERQLADLQKQFDEQTRFVEKKRLFDDAQRLDCLGALRSVQLTQESRDKHEFVDDDKHFRESLADHAQLNPAEWPGENGNNVEFEPGALKDESKRRFAENFFDVVASDLIALNRSIPDVRSPK